jgi:hypothetical protein
VSEDKRSGIRSDPNREDDEEYIVRLVGQVIREPGDRKDRERLAGTVFALESASYPGTNCLAQSRIGAPRKSC